MSVNNANRSFRPSALLEEAARYTASVVLRRCPNVQEVQLFGTVARGSAGMKSDLDLILIADIELARDFYDKVNRAEDADVYFNDRWSRYSCADQLLGALDPAENALDFFAAMARFYEMNTLLAASHRLYSDVADVVDVLLLPSDWTARHDEFQQLCGYRDHEFMKNVARDTRLIARR